MKYFYTVLIAMLPLVGFAQTNYHEGYVLKNNGDTLKGYINYREWSITPKVIDFKAKLDDRQVVQFSAKSIKEFQINGLELYVTYKGTISTAQTNLEGAPGGRDTSVVKDTVFLKRITTGRYLTLYSYHDDIKNRFFVAEKNSKPVELKYEVYKNGESELITMGIYKNQLAKYVYRFYPGNEKLNYQAQQLKYTQTDIEDFINLINNNTSVSTKRKAFGRFFAGIGLNSTITQVNYVTDADMVKNSTSVSPKISVGFDAFDNPNVQSLVFRMELSFSYIDPQFSYPANGLVYSFNQYNTTITPQILLNVYNKDNFKIYIDGGVGFNFSAFSNNKFALDNTAPGGARIITKPYELATRWTNFPFQTGMVFNKRVEVYFTYTPSSAYSDYPRFYATNQTLGLGLKLLMKQHK